MAELNRGYGITKRASMTPAAIVLMAFALLVCPETGRAQSTLATIPFETIPPATSFLSTGGITLLGAVSIDTMVPQDDSLTIHEGNILIESPFEEAIKMRDTALPNNPVFSLGRIVIAGDGSPEFRVIYSDDITAERSVFEFDNKGIVASVKQEPGSHFEGFLAGASQPLFRLNSFPSMELELGPGGSTPPDVALRRVGDSTVAILTNDEERFRIDEQGRVGVGTTTPMHPLEMASGAHVTSGGVWMNASSRLLKEDIRALDGEAALQAVTQLRPVSFTYKAEPGEEYLGFVAEEVPAMVSHAGRDTLSTMDLVAMLTKVVQGQQVEIQKLKDEITCLRKERGDRGEHRGDGDEGGGVGAGDAGGDRGQGRRPI